MTHPDPLLNTSYLAARRYTQPRRDPLTLDLDGDGLETLGINAAAPILFDHDGTGIKTASGWLKPDDAFLVLDRNGNGLIDSGRELFGDATVKSNGQLARDGFDALADLDANADGQISTLDSAFARLKLWRDLNQDGVSQANELTSLGQAGIASIKVVSSAHSQTLANGNEIADLGTFTRSDGSTGTTGEVTGRLADINLANNPFYRQFTDTLDTAAVADLPDLQGSGAVRDLREAATLSPTLADSLRQLVAHAATGTRADFRNAVAALIDQWADSAHFNDSFARAAAADQDLFFVPPGVSVLNAYNAHYGIIYAGPNGTLSDTPAHQQRIRDQQAQIERLLKTLETFNGLHFVAVPDNESTTSRPPSTLVAVSVPETGGGSGSILPDAPTPLIYALEQDRLNLLQQSAQALRQSVQDGLALQTRLRPLLDTLALQIDAQGARLDFSALDAEIDRRLAADAPEGFGDLVDFNRATRTLLTDSGWFGWSKVADLLANDPRRDSFRSVLAEDGALVKGIAGFSGSGGVGNDLLIGDGSANGSYGNAGDDGLVGLAGKDTLYDGAGNDLAEGGTGDDRLQGGSGNDTYLFTRGGGHDTLAVGDSGLEKVDTLRLVGLSPADVSLSKWDNSLTFVVRNTGPTWDWLCVENFFTSTANQIDRVEFGDGTVWSKADLVAQNVELYGDANANTLQGRDGGPNTFYAGAGNDVLFGGNGNDRLYGQEGNDTLYDGAGNDLSLSRRRNQNSWIPFSLNHFVLVTLVITALVIPIECFAQYSYEVYIINRQDRVVEIDQACINSVACSAGILGPKQSIWLTKKSRFPEQRLFVAIKTKKANSTYESCEISHPKSRCAYEILVEVDGSVVKSKDRDDCIDF